MVELIISDDFTIADIHKIRDYNYERRKDMTFEERKADIENGAAIGLKKIEQMRKDKVPAVRVDQ